jgi:hypothetical protein
VCEDAAVSPCSPTTAAPGSRGRLPWADLLRRVFADDVLQCACGGRRSVLAVVTDPIVARTYRTAVPEGIDYLFGRQCAQSEPNDGN